MLFRSDDPGAPAQDSSPYGRGLRSLVANDLAGAEAAFGQAIKAQPKSTAPLLGMAEIAFRKKKLDDAQRWIARALQVEPQDANAHASMGRYFAITGKPDQAIVSLSKAVELDTSAFLPRMDLADLLASRGKVAQALPLYEQAVALKPAHAGARYALGLNLARNGDPTRGLTELEQSVKLDPRNPLPQLGLARIQASRKAYPQALQALDKALAIQPTLFDALMLRADVFDAQGQADPAAAAYAKAAQAAPKAGLPWLKIGMLQQRLGKADVAEAAYRKAIELEPRQPIAYNNLADVLAERGLDLPQAQKWASKAVELAPKEANFRDTLGWIQRSRGDLQAARRSLELAVQITPTNGQFMYHLADVQARLGDKARAKKTLVEGLASPGGVASINEARKLLAELGG